MPEEQSVRAREGAADPQGCGNPLRSGIPFLTLLQQPTTNSDCFIQHINKKSTLLLLKAMIKPNREGKACLKSKASAPGKARPIRMDAGILCDRAAFPDLAPATNSDCFSCHTKESLSLCYNLTLS